MTKEMTIEKIIETSIKNGCDYFTLEKMAVEDKKISNKFFENDTFYILIERSHSHKNYSHNYYRLIGVYKHTFNVLEIPLFSMFSSYNEAKSEAKNVAEFESKKDDIFFKL